MSSQKLARMFERHRNLKIFALRIGEAVRGWSSPRRTDDR